MHKIDFFFKSFTHDVTSVVRMNKPFVPEDLVLSEIWRGRKTKQILSLFTCKYIFTVLVIGHSCNYFCAFFFLIFIQNLGKCFLIDFNYFLFCDNSLFLFTHPYGAGTKTYVSVLLFPFYLVDLDI